MTENRKSIIFVLAVVAIGSICLDRVGACIERENQRSSEMTKKYKKSKSTLMSNVEKCFIESNSSNDESLFKICKLSKRIYEEEEYNFYEDAKYMLNVYYDNQWYDDKNLTWVGEIHKAETHCLEHAKSDKNIEYCKLIRLYKDTGDINHYFLCDKANKILTTFLE